MESTDGEVLCEDGVARGRNYCTVGQRRCVTLSFISFNVNNPHFFLTDQIFLILYRELYYRHVYSRLSPNVDDRFHSYENSCELFNYLLSEFHAFLLFHCLTERRLSSRFGRSCSAGLAGPMALGYHRRVYLPIPVILRLAFKSQIKNGRGTIVAGGGWWPGPFNLRHFCGRSAQ